MTDRVRRHGRHARPRNREYSKFQPNAPPSWRDKLAGAVLAPARKSLAAIWLSRLTRDLDESCSWCSCSWRSSDMSSHKDRCRATDGCVPLEPHNPDSLSSTALEDGGANPSKAGQSRYTSAPTRAAPQLRHRVSATGPGHEVAPLPLHVRALQMDFSGQRSTRFNRYYRSQRIAFTRARKLATRRDFRDRSLPGIEGSGRPTDSSSLKTRLVGASPVERRPQAACDVAKVEQGEQA